MRGKKIRASVKESDVLVGEDGEHDSLAIIAILDGIEAALQERGFTLRIEDEDLEGVKNVRQAVDLVCDLIAREAS